MLSTTTKHQHQRQHHSPQRKEVIETPSRPGLFGLALLLFAALPSIDELTSAHSSELQFGAHRHFCNKTFRLSCPEEFALASFTELNAIASRRALASLLEDDDEDEEEGGKKGKKHRNQQHQRQASDEATASAVSSDDDGTCDHTSTSGSSFTSSSSSEASTTSLVEPPLRIGMATTTTSNCITTRAPIARNLTEIGEAAIAHVLSFLGAPSITVCRRVSKALNATAAAFLPQVAPGDTFFLPTATIPLLPKKKSQQLITEEAPPASAVGKVKGAPSFSTRLKNDPSIVTLFLGQLRREATADAVRWMIDSLVPGVTPVHIESHTNNKDGREKGCAWVFLSSEEDAQRLLKLDKRAFMDVDNYGQEGLWVCPPEERCAAALADFARARAACEERAAHLPRQPLVVERTWGKAQKKTIADSKKRKSPPATPPPPPPQQQQQPPPPHTPQQQRQPLPPRWGGGNSSPARCCCACHNHGNGNGQGQAAVVERSPPKVLYTHDPYGPTGTSVVAVHHHHYQHPFYPKQQQQHWVERW